MLVHRCLDCGARATSGGAEPRWLFTCRGCGLPFLAPELLPHAEHRCPACRAGQVPAQLPEPELAAAAETEIRAALAESWTFVGQPELAEYLDRFARRVAAHVDGVPEHVHVVLLDDRAHRTLALPSGALLLSLGAIEALDSEAELAFLIGHELAHAACGDAAVRLVRLGFQNVSRETDGGGSRPWAWAAEDLVRLGYGRVRERDADARALRATLALRFDPAAVVGYLGRLHDRMRAGDPGCAELLTSHPTPADRRRRLERQLHGRAVGEESLRVNREVLRRAASRETLRSSLVPARLEIEPPGFAARQARRLRRFWRSAAATALGVTLLGLLILAIALLLSR